MPIINPPSTGTGNATVPGDAPIQPAQAFVDAAIAKAPFGKITISPSQFNGGASTNMELANDPSVTSLTFTILVDTGTTGGALLIHDNENLTSLSFPALLHIKGTDLLIFNNPVLTSLSTPLLADLSAGAAFHIYSCVLLPSISLPNYTGYAISIHDNAAMSSISLPVFNQIGADPSLIIYNCPLLTSLTLSAQTTILDFEVYDNAALASLNLSALTTISAGGTLQAYNNAALASINISSLATFSASVDIEFQGNALPAAQVNAILAKVAAVANSTGVTDGNLDLSGGTNAAPTGQGLTDKATLEGAGWTVTTN